MEKEEANGMEEKTRELKKLTIEEFENLAEWKTQSDTVKEKKKEYLVETKTGFRFYTGSNDERRIFNKRLKKDDTVADVRDQELAIPYKGYKGKEHNYRPDFVAHYHDGSVLILEIKPVMQMAMDDVLRKMKSLKKYAYKNKFNRDMWGMIGGRGKIWTLREIQSKSVRPNFKKYVDETISEKGFFDESDLRKYRKEHKSEEKHKLKKLKADLTSLVINNQHVYRMSKPEGKSIYSWEIKKAKAKPYKILFR